MFGNRLVQRPEESAVVALMNVDRDVHPDRLGWVEWSHRQCTGAAARPVRPCARDSGYRPAADESGRRRSRRWWRRCRKDDVAAEDFPATSAYKERATRRRRRDVAEERAQRIDGILNERTGEP